MLVEIRAYKHYYYYYDEDSRAHMLIVEQIAIIRRRDKFIQREKDNERDE